MMNSAQINRSGAGHPGPFVRSQVLDRLGLSVTDAAAVVGITRAAFSTFLNGRASLSADMALRIEKAFAIPMDKLMHMQCDYDIAQARARQGEVHVGRFKPALSRLEQQRRHEGLGEGR